MSEFRMPSLGADMEAGTLVEWLKKPGDAVKRGDIVAVVETQKGAIEVEIFQDGTIDRLLVEPGIEVPVGTPLALVHVPGEAPAAEAPRASVRPEEARREEPGHLEGRPEKAAPPPAPRPAAPPAGARLRISPVAASRAAELGVDPRKIAGTGPGGAITLADVESAAKPKAPAAPAPTAAKQSPVSAMRQAIAAAMGRSKREIPHYYLGTTIDMGTALSWLEEANKARPVPQRLLYGVLLIKAVALALAEVPELNGFWADGQAAPSRAIHVGWAISLRGGGLVAPAIHDADKKSLDDLMATLRDLVGRARRGGLRSSELSDPTITVTNLGEQGVERVYGVIFPPQLALVGFGRIARRPWVVGDAVVPRPVVEATLSADHRASDGHRGGLFLAALDRQLQEPQSL
jgi:pyruvate dehydrogenase E2 component (dihydrolipoyllysine-residue acetyltransferase)